MSDHSSEQLQPAAATFSFQHTVHVIGFNPEELHNRALLEAARFFGPGAELHVVSAESEPHPDYKGHYKATVVFRQVAGADVHIERR